MGNKSSIEWTDATWNPIRGCSRVSDGCRHCYAESVAHRFSGVGLPYEGLVQLDADGKSTGKWNGSIKFVEPHLLDPLKWKKPRRIFVNSMSDLFHENVTDEIRDKIFAVIALCPQHTFQILTKRPERMREYLTFPIREALIGLQVGNIHLQRTGEPVSEWSGMPLPNAQLGVSGEDQETVTKRCWVLLQTPAAIRFLSLEPMLGPVNLNAGELICKTWRKGATIGRYLDWVIVGGESGPGARPMNPDWVRSVRDQCEADCVPFFFKQWGEWTKYDPSLHGPYSHKTFIDYSGRVCGAFEANPDGLDMRDWERIVHVGKKSAGSLLDGVAYHEFPEVSA